MATAKYVYLLLNAAGFEFNNTHQIISLEINAQIGSFCKYKVRGTAGCCLRKPILMFSGDIFESSFSNAIGKCNRISELYNIEKDFLMKT